MMDNNIILQQLLYNLQRNEYIDRPTSDTDIHVVPHNLPHSDVPVALYKDTDHLSFSNRGNVENTAREIGRIEKSFPMRQEIKFTRFPKEEVIRGVSFCVAYHRMRSDFYLTFVPIMHSLLERKRQITKYSGPYYLFGSDSVRFS